jgi:hypothetical protein
MSAPPGQGRPPALRGLDHLPRTRAAQAGLQGTAILPRKAKAPSLWGIMGVYTGMSFKTNSLQIIPDLLTLVAEIDEFKDAWRALGALAPEHLSALRHVATIESIGSSMRIEGGKLSDADVGRLLAKLNIKSFETRDEQEVAGYAQVMETIFGAYDVIDLTEKRIMQLLRDLLAFSIKDERHRGAYKARANPVSA